MEGEALNNGREKEKGGKAKKAKHKGKEGIGRALVSVFVLDCKRKEQKKQWMVGKAKANSGLRV